VFITLNLFEQNVCNALKVRKIQTFAPLTSRISTGFSTDSVEKSGHVGNVDVSAGNGGRGAPHGSNKSGGIKKHGNDTFYGKPSGLIDGPRIPIQVFL